MGFTLNQLEQERQLRKLQKKEDKDTSDYEQLSNLPKINNVELKGDKTGADLGLVNASDMTAQNVSYDNTASGLTATDVQGAVDELATIGGKVVKSVTADGIKTYRELLNELYVSRSDKLILKIGNHNHMPSTATRYGAITTASGTNNVEITLITLSDTSSLIKRYQIADNGDITVTADTNNIPTVDTVFSLVQLY